MRNLQEFLSATTAFIGNALIPLLFAIALLFFIWNTVRFFIISGAEQDAKENAKRLALYGIGAFVLLVSIWGIVNLLINGLGLNDGNYVDPDYIINTDRNLGDYYRECPPGSPRLDCL